LEAVPTSQSRQTPSEVEYLPEPQLWQSLEKVLPVPNVPVPGEQVVHTLTPPGATE
jgi:hypothetical protein